MLTFWAEKEHLKPGERIYVNVLADQSIDEILRVEWNIVRGKASFDTLREEISSKTDRSIPFRLIDEGVAEIYAKISFWDRDIKYHEIDTRHLTIYARANSSDSDGSSGGGSGRSSGSSSSRSSEAAKAPAPLPAITPVVTDSSGISHFGNAVIAQPPAAYPEQERISLISTGAWTENGIVVTKSL